MPEALANLKKRSAKLMHYLFPMAILFMLSSRYIFQLLYNRDLLEGFQIFNIYLLLIISRMLFPQTVLLGIHKSRSFYLSSALEIIVNVALALMFVSWMGIQGAAWAMVIAFMAEKLILLWFCRLNNIRLHDFVPLTTFLFYSAACGASYFLSLYLFS